MTKVQRVGFSLAEAGRVAQIKIAPDGIGKMLSMAYQLHLSIAMGLSK